MPARPSSARLRHDRAPLQPPRIRRASAHQRSQCQVVGPRARGRERRTGRWASAPGESGLGEDAAVPGHPARLEPRRGGRGAARYGGRDGRHGPARPTLLAVMQTLDVFVRPTYFDGDAGSVREALALGVRVVASETDSRPQGVWRFPCGDADALAAAIDAALARPAPRIDSTSLPALL